MAISVGVLEGMISAQLMCVGVLGSEKGKLAKACAKAYIDWLKGYVKVTTVDVGTLGVGKGTGPVVGALGPLMMASCVGMAPANSIIGIMGPIMCGAIGLACGNCTLMAVANTTHAGVGIGAGMGMLVNNNASDLFTLLKSEFAANGLNGESKDKLCNALAMGIAPILSTAVIPVVIVGSPNIIPGGGSGNGFIS